MESFKCSLQCSATQTHRTHNWENTLEEPKWLSENRSMTSQILTIRQILEGVLTKNREATILFIDFTKAFDSIQRGKMEQIILAYGQHKESIAAIMMLHRNTKVNVRSPDGDTDYFDIVVSVLQEDTLAPYLFIICQDYVLRTSIDKMKDNGFKLTKERSRRYPAQAIMGADYADQIVLLVNTPTQAETQLHSLERAAAGRGLHVNAHKTEYMCFNQRDDISTLNGSSQKLIDKFTYLGSFVSSTNRDIKRVAKAWTANDRLSVIWKSDLTDKVKRRFSKQCLYRYCCMDELHGRQLNVWRKGLTATNKNTASCIEKVLETTTHKTAVRKLSMFDELSMRETAGEEGRNS